MTEMEEQAYEDFADSSSWASMDPELKEAACCGDVDFLKSALASCKPPAYFLSRFTHYSEDKIYGRRFVGNILHLAILHGRVEFVAVAMSMLSEKIIHLLLSQQETTGGQHWNPLHVAVREKNSTIVEKIANCGYDEVFVAKDSDGRTPALLAIQTGDSKSASILMTGSLAELIKNVGDHQGGMPLYWAVCNGLYDVVLNLLGCQGTLCCTGPYGSTALHVMIELASAPEDIQDEIFGKLLRRFPELITATDDWGTTVLHEWVRRSCQQWTSPPQGLMRTFEYFFDHYPDVAVELMRQTDHFGNNPLHIITTSRDGWGAALAEKLIDLYRECTAVLTTQTSQNHEWPWLMNNHRGHIPLVRAIRNACCDLAWCFIRKTPVDVLSIGDEKTCLTLDLQNGCSNFGPDILRTTIEGEEFLLIRYSPESNTLHLTSTRAEKLIAKVLHKFPSLIIQPDSRDLTPLDKASAGGLESLVKLMLGIVPSSLESSPSAWIKACENGHVSVILVFIKHYPNFRGFCHEHRDTPLHHIKLGSYKEYKEFLVIDKLIKEQKNTQDMNGATPLHRAIGMKDMNLTEALLTGRADRTIKDKDDKTVVDLLAEVCNHHDEWYAMCKRVGIDPRLTTTYVQRETNLLEMRGALSVVAGLLATITFTAGFTLPGGFNNDTGEALLAKDAAFLVFLLADAYAMCCSMLVLCCLIWSMISDSNKTLLLMDRSVVILLQSLYATLVAFMTGVFTVIFHKSLWAAIVVFVMCSVIGISATIRSILFWLIDKMVPSTDTENGYQNRLLKALGKAFASRQTGSQESSTAIDHIV